MKKRKAKRKPDEFERWCKKSIKSFFNALPIDTLSRIPEWMDKDGGDTMRRREHYQILLGRGQGVVFALEEYRRFKAKKEK